MPGENIYPSLMGPGSGPAQSPYFEVKELNYVCTCAICERIIDDCDAVHLVQGALGNDLPVCRECHLELHQTEDEGVSESGC